MGILAGASATGRAQQASERRPAPGEADVRGDSSPFADSYYFDTCAACKAQLGAKGQSADVLEGGRELRFCSPECRDAFERSPDQALSRIDARMIEDQRPHYPLSTSIVSGEPLPQPPVEFIWGNRLFRVATLEERNAIVADPARFIGALDDAVIAAQTPNYPMPDKCPVQGDILSSDTPTEVVVANRMILVCCGRCVRVVRARPAAYLALVEHATRAAAERRPGAPAAP